MYFKFNMVNYNQLTMPLKDSAIGEFFQFLKMQKVQNIQ